MPSPKKKTAPELVAKQLKSPVTRELNEFQKLVIDQFADMVIRGANAADTETVLSGLLSHHYRQIFYRGELADWEEATEQADKFVKKNLGQWAGKLSMSWPRRAESPSIEPATVTERIRADARGRLRGRFEDFLAESAPEEVLLLDTVLQDWESSHGRADNDDVEIDLAHAFAQTFGNCEHYIKVPRKHWNLIVDYLNLLDGKECGKAA